jgi:neurofibromin 1
LEDIACQLDQLLGLSFSADFSFSMASILFKGIRHDKLRKAAERSLRCLLRTAIRAYQPNGTRSVITRHALGYFIALISTTATTEAYHELVVDCDCDIAAAIPFESDGYLTDNTVPRISLEFIGAHDINTALLVVTFLQSILSSAQGDDIETQIFTTLLADIAALHPDIVCMAYVIV